jgi:hypothetical protein
MTPEEVNQQKDVEFYAASVNAWYNTSLEHDKSIFALSAGGVGLLITLLTTVGVTSTMLLWLYITAILFFLVALCSMLYIFRRNRTHVEDVLSGQTASDPVLDKLDLVAISSFALGAVFTAVVGISAAFNSYESKGVKVANEKPINTAPVQSTLGKSFNDVGRLQNSFNGIGRVQPQSVGGQSTPSPAPAPAAPATPASGGSGTGSGTP